MSSVTVPVRFNGPPDSAHGGYCAGLIAALVDDPVLVELRAPPPLAVPMRVVESGDGVEVFDGEVLVARARRSPAPDFAPPAVVSIEAAAHAADGYAGFVDHPFPTCFACGPERSAGDGLRIFAGPVPEAGMVAASWRPDPAFAAPDGSLDPAIVWAALDCPSGFAVFDGRVAVLAGLQVRQDQPVPVGDELVVLGWGRGEDGRKLRAASAIQDAAGRVLAVAEALWIELPTR